MRLPAKQASKERGMALLLVLVAVMALALIVVGLYESSQASWEESSLSRARYQAGLLAESGLSIALHPQIKPGAVALKQNFGTDRGFEVIITSEGGRLPVNELTEERMRETAVELFILWGLDAAVASRAADSITDWIDDDSDPLPNGAENGYYAGLGYPQFPSNAAFTSLEQLLFVAGMDAVERVEPFWRDYFTIHSDGLIDLNEAPKELIAALTRTTEDAALKFVAVRAGDDGIAGTEDDYRFTDSGEVQALLGLSDGEWTALSSFVTLSGTVKRIESTGQIGEFRETRVILAEEITEGRNTVLTPLARFRK
jgi:general secretion pathway protein K